MVLYHVSPKRNRESILIDGLKLNSHDGMAISFKDKLFASTTLNDAAFDYVGFDCIDVWEFDYDGPVHPDMFSHNKNHVYIEENIPAEKVRLVQTIESFQK